MKNRFITFLTRRKPAHVSCLAFCCFFGFPVMAQIQSVSTAQHLHFGAFATGTTGGTVIISSEGSRSVTGTVVPINLGLSYYQAIFEVEAPIGTVISIMKGPDITLSGSNGGSMTMRIGNTSPGTPFISSTEPPVRTQVHVGGTLTVGNTTTSPPGNYTGTFYITFNNE